MIINDFKAFKGKHCESSSIGNLLTNQDLKLSEPMIFGLGEGLSFIYWKMKSMNLPFLGGRNKQFDLTRNLCRNLELKLDARETTSTKKAWKNITEFIDDSIPVSLQLDCYHLEYFTHKIHFAGHFLTVYGYDEEYVYVSDTMLQDLKHKSKIKNIELARFEKGQMSAKARSFTIKVPDKRIDLKKAIITAIKNNADAFLNPPISNLTYRGIKKLGTELPKWRDMAKNPEIDLVLAGDLMEGAGTGGALFRNLYRDFLKEASEMIPENDYISQAYSKFCLIAPKWTQIAELIQKAGKTGDSGCLEKASVLSFELAAMEKQAMEILLEAVKKHKQ